MQKTRLTSDRKKKIKTVLSMMNKQNQRFVPITQSLVEMMDLVTTDEELDYLLKMGTGLYDYQQAAEAGNGSGDQFESFFDTSKGKGWFILNRIIRGKKYIG